MEPSHAVQVGGANVFPHLMACLTEVTGILFEMLELPAVIRPGAAPVEGRSICATIGFAAEHAKGVLAIQASPEVAVIFAPGRSPIDEAVGEALGELSNVLLGRFKNELLPLGPTLTLSLPLVTRGKCLHVGGAISRTCAWLEVVLPQGSVYVMLAGTFAGDFQIAPWQRGSARRRFEMMFF